MNLLKFNPEFIPFPFQCELFEYGVETTEKLVLTDVDLAIHKSNSTLFQALSHYYLNIDQVHYSVLIGVVVEVWDRNKGGLVNMSIDKELIITKLDTPGPKFNPENSYFNTPENAFATCLKLVKYTARNNKSIFWRDEKPQADIPSEEKELTLRFSYKIKQKVPVGTSTLVQITDDIQDKVFLAPLGSNPYEKPVNQLYGQPLETNYVSVVLIKKGKSVKMLICPDRAVAPKTDSNWWEKHATIVPIIDQNINSFNL